MTQTFIIPKNRIGVLIGPDGAVKKTIEESLNVKLTIDSRSGDVNMKSVKGDPLNELKAKDVVHAIGKGFSPQKAFQLFNEDEIIEIIDLRDIFGRNESQIHRVKGRIIGMEGKARRVIEEMMGVVISVYGHTVALIGGYENVTLAREAIRMLIEGKQHNTVYKYLRIKKGELKKRMKVELWENTSKVGA